MKILISEARTILSDESKKYTDSQIEEIVSQFTVLADIAIDTYMANHKNLKKSADVPLYKKLESERG